MTLLFLCGTVVGSEAPVTLQSICTFLHVLGLREWILPRYSFKKKVSIQTDNPFFFTLSLKICKLFIQPFDWRNVYQAKYVSLNSFLLTLGQLHQISCKFTCLRNLENRFALQWGEKVSVAPLIFAGPCADATHAQFSKWDCLAWELFLFYICDAPCMKAPRLLVRASVFWYLSHWGRFCLSFC